MFLEFLTEEGLLREPDIHLVSMLYTALFRVIQMNMEMSLLSAHLLILFDADPQMMNLCRIVSILIHMFYVTCFVFTFLEALHTYRCTVN